MSGETAVQISQRDTEMLSDPEKLLAEELRISAEKFSLFKVERKGEETPEKIVGVFYFARKLSEEDAKGMNLEISVDANGKKYGVIRDRAVVAFPKESEINKALLEGFNITQTANSNNSKALETVNEEAGIDKLSKIGVFKEIVKMLPNAYIQTLIHGLSSDMDTEDAEVLADLYSEMAFDKNGAISWTANFVGQDSNIEYHHGLEATLKSDEEDKDTPYYEPPAEEYTFQDLLSLFRERNIPNNYGEKRGLLYPTFSWLWNRIKNVKSNIIIGHFSPSYYAEQVEYFHSKVLKFAKTDNIVDEGQSTGGMAALLMSLIRQSKGQFPKMTIAAMPAGWMQNVFADGQQLARTFLATFTNPNSLRGLKNLNMEPGTGLRNLVNFFKNLPKEVYRGGIKVAGDPIDWIGSSIAEKTVKDMMQDSSKKHRDNQKNAFMKNTLSWLQLTIGLLVQRKLKVAEFGKIFNVPNVHLFASKDRLLNNDPMYEQMITALYDLSERDEITHFPLALWNGIKHKKEGHYGSKTGIEDQDHRMTISVDRETAKRHIQAKLNRNQKPSDEEIFVPHPLKIFHQVNAIIEDREKHAEFWKGYVSRLYNYSTNINRDYEERKDLRRFLLGGLLANALVDEELQPEQISKLTNYLINIDGIDFLNGTDIEVDENQEVITDNLNIDSRSPDKMASIADKIKMCLKLVEPMIYFHQRIPDGFKVAWKMIYNPPMFLPTS